MRAIAVSAGLVIAACSTPSTSSTSSPSPLPTASAVASPAATACKLPVYWEASTASGIEIRAAFVSVPDGTVTQVSAPTPLPFVYGAVFDSASNAWLGVDRDQLSPDGRRYVYWKGNPDVSEIHVVDLAINPRQGAYEKLYRLDPSTEGAPVLVAGSDRHMYQWGWVLISDGAAWGIDYRVDGNAYIYSVLRLDLSTSKVTPWFEDANDLPWPLGNDGAHSLYVQGVGQDQLWRLAAPGRAEQLANPGPISLADELGGPTNFIADSTGAWFAGRGGVWLYSDGAAPRQFTAGQATDDVLPAGPCI